MKLITSINHMIEMKRLDGGNGCWGLWGDIMKDKKGNYYYTEYAKENPRTVNINDLPQECKDYIITLL